MIPKECKRLAEVDFPIAVVSKHSAREKSIRHGHPSTLHLWWARRPLAACRSMLMALLLPDPCDEHCPADFKEKAAALLASEPPVPWTLPDGTDMGLRKSLLSFIGDFANWDNSSSPVHLRVARGLVKAAHAEETPLVVDPFAGGGSIPLEALRIGCDAFASDLNPVACLILKVMLEEIPRHGPKLAEDLRRVGAEIKTRVEQDLAEFYPKDPDGATPIVYLWARTVRCESPKCGAEFPLVRSFWLCNTRTRRRALRTTPTHSEGRREVEFEVFEPGGPEDVAGPTVSRAKATCMCCGRVMPPSRVRSQLIAQDGGADAIFDPSGVRIGGARILAVITLRPGESGRHYRVATNADYYPVWRAHQKLRSILHQWEAPGRTCLSPVPQEPISPNEIRRINVPIYGMVRWGQLFSERQNLTLVSLVEGIRRVDELATREVLACAFDVFARSCNANARMRPDSSVAPAFGMHALPITWTFPETVISGGRSEHFDGAIATVANAITGLAHDSARNGQVQLANATASPLPSESCSILFTDPPYYDSIPYAHIADFFFVWLKRTLSGHPLLGAASQDDTTPKEHEIVVDRPHRLSTSKKDAQFYESGMARAFAEGRRLLRQDGIGSVVFAHKTTEGWEALLSGMIRGGWTVTGSWPIATENASRLVARETASLATSVHLVCRPRPQDATVGDWASVLRELPNRVGDWMERLQAEGIRGADLVFACIGPALEIFSRYSKVETADGREVRLAEYLEKVWEVVGRTALEQVLGTDEAKARNGAAGALEEDARLTALFLWTLQSTNGKNGSTTFTTSGAEEESEDDAEDDDESAPKSQPKGFSLIFDVVRRFAQPLGIELPKWEDRIIKTEKGVVRLLPVTERAKQLFGEDGARAVADWIVNDPIKNIQTVLFPEAEVAAAPKVRGRSRVGARDKRGRKIDLDPSALDTGNRNEATTLDRVHAAMLLQAGGQTNALRALLKAEQDRGPDFLRLANALSALYPKGSEEKRLLDAMLLAVPR